MSPEGLNLINSTQHNGSDSQPSYDDKIRQSIVIANADGMNPRNFILPEGKVYDDMPDWFDPNTPHSVSVISKRRTRWEWLKSWERQSEQRIRCSDWAANLYP